MYGGSQARFAFKDQKAIVIADNAVDSREAQSSSLEL